MEILTEKSDQAFLLQLYSLSRFVISRKITSRDMFSRRCTFHSGHQALGGPQLNSAPPFIDPEAETFITAFLFIIILIPAPLFDKGAKLLTQVTTRIGDSVRSANLESTEWDRKLEN